MGKRAAKTAVVFVEIISIVVAALAAFSGFLLWRLSQGPVDAGFLKYGIEASAQNALGAGHQVSIDSVTLALNPLGGLDLRLSGADVRNPQGTPSAAIPRVDINLSARSLLKGGAAVHRISVQSPQFQMERRQDGDVNFLDRLRGLEGFQSLSIVDGGLQFLDPGTGNAWTARAVHSTFDRSDDGYEVSLDGVFTLGGAEGQARLVAVYTRASGLMTAELRLDNAPLGDILGALGGDQGVVLSAPFTGDAALTMGEAGKILSASIDGEAGRGRLLVGKRALPMERVAFAAGFDPAKNAFDIERAQFDIGGSTGAFSGVVTLQGDGVIERAAFDLNGQDARIVLDGVLPGPLDVRLFAVEGAYDASANRVAVNALRVEVLDVILAGKGEYRRSRTNLSPEIRADLTLDGDLDPQRLLAAWPLSVGTGARDFVNERLPTARIHSVSARIDLAEGAATQDGIPDEALAVSFGVDGATAHYAPTMTPLSDASGSALLTGARFVVKEARGRVGAVAISDGDIDFTKLSPKGEPVYFRFSADGQARDVLAVLNQEPISILQTTTFTPDQFAGKANIRAEIMRPNHREVPREDYRYIADATFSGVAIADFYRSVDLEQASGTVRLSSAAMVIGADAKLGGSPVDIEWTQPLDAVGRDGKFVFSGALDSSTGDIFGFPTRQLLQGSAPFKATATGTLGAFRSMEIDADFTEAALTASVFGWRKPQGAPARSRVALTMTPAGLDLKKIEFNGDGIDVDGSISFSPNGAINRASFERFRLNDAADFTVSATRSDSGALDVVLFGAFMNVANLIADAVESKPEPDAARPTNFGGGFTLRARLDKLAMRAGIEYRDASLDVRQQGGKLQNIDFSARSTSGAPLSVGMKNTGADEGPTRAVEARTDDIGALLAGVFGITSIRGGEGSMEIMAGGTAEEGLSGICEVRGMRVVDAPLLARIFAAGSFDGLADLLNGEGVLLNQAFAKFGYSKGVLKLAEARASGPSVGITGAGSIATAKSGGIDLQGAIVPAYGVNSLLGKAPLIGDLFVSREGEGVVALSYVVTGQSSEPVVTVNPLSALAPGFLRRLFELPRESAAGGTAQVDQESAQ